MSQSLETWKRQKKESAKAYEAAKLYFDMGPERTQEEVSKRLAKSRQIISRWSAQWNWVERAAAYDSHIAIIEQIAKEKAIEKEAAKWAERQEVIREDGWNLFLALKNKAEQMLRFPVARTEVKENGTVILPADWNFNTARAMADTAIKLGRLAADLSTENFDFDPRRLSDKQLAAARSAIQSGKSVAEAIRTASED